MLHTSECEGYTAAFYVDFDHFDLDVLVETHNLRGILDAFFSHLRYVDKAAFVNTEVYESSEVGNIVDDARKNHPLAQVGNVVYGVVELHGHCFVARVASWLLKFGENIVES